MKTEDQSRRWFLAGAASLPLLPHIPLTPVSDEFTTDVLYKTSYRLLPTLMPSQYLFRVNACSVDGYPGGDWDEDA